MENLSEQIIKGYELIERIGAGGFGAVYKAHQSTIGRDVAIKIILPGLANHPDFIRRFESEAHVIARLEHPYIVPLYDYWRDPEGAYLVMRWLRGGSLRMALKRDGAMELESAARLLDHIASALDLAHRHDVIHRDIKPGNILLDEDGNAYLADFGIAKDLTGVDGSQTGADDIVGSLDYISPEQARSESVTPRTDIYSLGVTLYEILTGEHPFANISSVERLYKHINDPLPEINTLDANIRDAVNDVISKATAKDPAKRYEDALSFATDFRQAINMSDQIASQLTQREYEVLARIIDGLSNKQIASELFIAVSTVKTYINQIYSKLGVRSRVQAKIRAHELNLMGGAGMIPEVPSSISRLPEPDNPYKGLRAFQAADHRDFFGRETLVAKLLDKMNEDDPSSRFLAVIGPSGSGKSSLVKAGLVPAIWNGGLPGSDRWFIAEMLPGNHPIEELEVALTRVATQQINTLNEHLLRDERGLLRATRLILPEDDTELVLVIDQFEEVFTLTDDEDERQHFLNILQAAVTDTRSRVRIIITLRADFYDKPLHYVDFGEMLQSRMETLLPLSSQELERAIIEPAKREGVSFEEGLSAQIISDVNYQSGALPLLQYALTELFEQREDRVLTHEAYRKIGGAVGALASRADELYGAFDEPGQDMTQRMFLRLVTLGEGTDDTRRRANRSELLAIADDEDVMDEVIDLFAEYRLLALDHDPATRSPTVEVAHEAILSEWDTLRNWINLRREDIKMQQQIARMAEEWEQANRDTSYLASGYRLEQMEGWANETELALTKLEREFLNASVTERERRKAVEHARKERELTLEYRSAQRLRWLVAVFVIATFVAGGLAITARNQRIVAEEARATSEANARIAQQQANENRSLYLTNEAQDAARNDDALLALALSAEAVRVDSASEQSIQFLNEIAWQSAAIRHFEGHTKGITTVVFSPDSKTAVSGSNDGAITLWDVATGTIINRFEGHTDDILDVDFNPDGTRIVSTTRDAIILWDTTTGQEIRRFEGYKQYIATLDISPDGTSLIGGACGDATPGDCNSGEIILWDMATGDILNKVQAHESRIRSLAFSPDGQLVVSASLSEVILWDIVEQNLVESARLFVEFTAFKDVTFAPDSSVIFAALSNGSVVRQAISESDAQTVFVGEQRYTAMAFSRDFQTIAYPFNNALILDSLENSANSVQQQYMGHDDRIRSIAFSPDGKTILSGSNDGSLILWDTHSSGEIGNFSGHHDETWGLAISPDGHAILGSGGRSTCKCDLIEFLPINSDNSLLLWDAETGEIIRRFEGHEYGVADVLISPDGRLIVSAAGDGTIGLWDLDNGELVRHFENLPSLQIDISPDGQTLIAGEASAQPVLLDINNGNIIYTFAEPSPASGAAVAYSPDGKMVASTIYNGLVLWDTETSDEISRANIGQAPIIHDMVFSKDGQLIAVASRIDGIFVLDVTTGEIVHHFQSYDRYAESTTSANGVAFSSDDKRLLTAWDSGDVVLWDLATGMPTHLGEHADAVWRVAFTPNGIPVSSSLDGTVKMWAIPDENLLDWVEANRYIRPFTCEERETYRIEPYCDSEDSE